MVENISNSSVVVGTTAVLIVPVLTRGKRNALTIVNTSTAGQIVTLSWGPEAIAGKGVVLYPGGSWSESRESVFTPSTEGIWAIASAATGAVAIHDRIEAVI